MSKVFIEESTLTAIGNAIRAKEGSTDLIAPGNMATKIANLPTGGGGGTPSDDLYLEMVTGTNKGANITSLPNGITTIRPYAFARMNDLAITSIPDSVTNIGVCAFDRCNKMTLSGLPSNLVSIGANAFTEVKFTSPLIIPASVTTIQQYMFGSSSYTGKPMEVIFLGTPESINQAAFNALTGAVTVKVPWSEGEVAKAPWGLGSSATIVYDYIHEEV